MGVGALTANNLSITLDMDMKYPWNQTHMVHKNIFCIASPHDFRLIFIVKYASIDDIIAISFFQRAMQS